jgi:hypothetical protein
LHKTLKWNNIKLKASRNPEHISLISKPPFTFHHMPETLFQCGIEGETCSFHRCGFVSPVWGWGWEAAGGDRKVKGARFTLDPASGQGFGHIVKGETYFRIND